MSAEEVEKKRRVNWLVYKDGELIECATKEEAQEVIEPDISTPSADIVVYCIDPKWGFQRREVRLYAAIL